MRVPKLLVSLFGVGSSAQLFLLAWLLSGLVLCEGLKQVIITRPWLK